MLVFTNRGNTSSLQLVSPASPAPVLTTGASSYPTPPHRLPPHPPPISTLPRPSPTSPPPTLRPPPTTPPPLFRTSTRPSPSANSPPPPPLAPPDPGPPASLPPQHPPPRSPSAPRHRWASATCRPPARSHTCTCRPSQSGMNLLISWLRCNKSKRKGMGKQPTHNSDSFISTHEEFSISATAFRIRHQSPETNNMST